MNTGQQLMLVFFSSQMMNRDEEVLKPLHVAPRELAKMMRKALAKGMVAGAGGARRSVGMAVVVAGSRRAAASRGVFSVARGAVLNAHVVGGEQQSKISTPHGIRSMSIVQPTSKLSQKAAPMEDIDLELEDGPVQDIKISKSGAIGLGDAEVEEESEGHVGGGSAKAEEDEGALENFDIVRIRSLASPCRSCFFPPRFSRPCP